MKKIMYIAAALLVLVGCQKSQEAKENAPVNYGTITGKIELPQGPNKISAREGLQSEGDIQMQWEEGDEIYIGNESGVELLTLKSIDEQTGFATFEGKLLSDMNSYTVYYGFDPLGMDEEDIEVPYIAGNYRPFAVGEGTSESFIINNFMPVFGMRLKGTAALTKIEAIFEVSFEDCNHTMTFETPLQLSSEPQIVYFPVSSHFTDWLVTFKFYDAGGLILTKEIEKVTFDLNEVITFTSALEINGAAPAPTYEYVDLGLTVNWATFNVGATKPEEYGDYFAWGETEPYYTGLNADGSATGWKTGKESGYAWASYFDTKDGGLTFQKYYFEDYFENGKTTLDPEDDAAHVNWGGNWRMPTKQEQYDLQDYCTWTWTTDYNNTGIAGYIVKSKANTNSIFLPAAGYYDNASLCNVGSWGVYWSPSLSSLPGATVLFFRSDDKYPSGNYRYYGLSVRPVCPK